MMKQRMLQKTKILKTWCFVCNNINLLTWDQAQFERFSYILSNGCNFQSETKIEPDLRLYIFRSDSQKDNSKISTSRKGLEHNKKVKTMTDDKKWRNRFNLKSAGNYNIWG